MVVFVNLNLFCGGLRTFGTRHGLTTLKIDRPSGSPWGLGVDQKSRVERRSGVAGTRLVVGYGCVERFGVRVWSRVGLSGSLLTRTSAERTLVESPD